MAHRLGFPVQMRILFRKRLPYVPPAAPPSGFTPNQGSMQFMFF